MRIYTGGFLTIGRECFGLTRCDGYVGLTVCLLQHQRATWSPRLPAPLGHHRSASIIEKENRRKRRVSTDRRREQSSCNTNQRNLRPTSERVGAAAKANDRLTAARRPPQHARHIRQPTLQDPRLCPILRKPVKTARTLLDSQHFHQIRQSYTRISTPTVRSITQAMLHANMHPKVKTLVLGCDSRAVLGAI